MLTLLLHCPVYGVMQCFCGHILQTVFSVAFWTWQNFFLNWVASPGLFSREAGSFIFSEEQDAARCFLGSRLMVGAAVGHFFLLLLGHSIEAVLLESFLPHCLVSSCTFVLLLAIVAQGFEWYLGR